LALALKVWTAVSSARSSWADPADELRKPALGCAAHPRRALEVGIGISQATVAKYMVRWVGTPSPTWRSFLRNEAIGIAAIDMFVAVSVSFRLLYVMIILAHGRREIVRFDVTRYPTAAWLSQQVIEAFPWDTAPRYLLRDRDGSYGPYFRKRVEAMGITEVITAPRSPWQNAYVERVISSIRRECLDQVVIFNERHLRRVLSSYVDYYHRTRTHLSLGKDCPHSRPIQPPRTGRVIAIRKPHAIPGHQGCASKIRERRLEHSPMANGDQILESAFVWGFDQRDDVAFFALPENHFAMRWAWTLSPERLARLMPLLFGENSYFRHTSYESPADLSFNWNIRRVRRGA
jgi:transposase InsO family protein